MTRAPRTFLPTRWSLVARASSSEAPGAREALEELCRAYWWPLYAYLRRLGLDHEEAADVVQGLFADLLAKKRLAHADPAKGKFRSWLLQALKYHLSHERERGRAAKRGGAARTLSIDREEAERRWAHVPDPERDPEQVYERAWAIEVLARALRVLEERYVAGGKATLFAALKPRLVGELEAEDLHAVGRALGQSTAALKTAAHRMRRTLAGILRAELAATLGEGCDVEEEVRSLFSALSPQKGAKV